MSATASNQGGGGSISRVDFLVDGTVVASTNVPAIGNIYTTTWTPPAPAAHTFAATAYTARSVPGTATAVTTTLDNHNPTASLTGVTDGQSYQVHSDSNPHVFHLQATGTDPDSGDYISASSISINGAQVATGSSSASYDWTPTPGDYTVTATVLDKFSAGNTATATVNITTNAYPSITLNSPTGPTNLP